MDKNQERMMGLKAAGVPRHVIPYTLPKLGQVALRDAVMAKRFSGDDKLGLFVYAINGVNTETARDVFYTAAKELFLTGVRVQCTALVPFSAMVEAFEVPENIQECDMLFISDFYESGCAMPYSDHVAASMRYWLRHWFDSGKTAAFLSDAPVSAMTGWWPTSMSEFLGKRVMACGV